MMALLEITRFTDKPVLPITYQNDAWSRLAEAVDAVLTSRRIECSQEVLYSFVENLCAHGNAEKVYTELQSVSHRIM